MFHRPGKGDVIGRALKATNQRAAPRANSGIYKCLLTKLPAEIGKADNIAEELELECGPMPNVMAAQPNIGGALCKSSVT